MPMLVFRWNSIWKKQIIQFKDSYVQPYKDGHNYIIPCLVEAYAVTYCNQNLMKEIGLSMPQTLG